MRMPALWLLVLVLIAGARSPAAAGDVDYSPGGFLDLRPCVNEVSLYQNLLDQGDAAGQTLQVISINSVKLGYWLDLEITLDVNHDMDRTLNPEAPDPERYDYYLEVGLVKPLSGRWKVNYQRIYGTFVAEPVNQIGLRLAF